MRVSWNSFSKDEWCSAGRGFSDWNVYQHWDYGEVHSRGLGRRVDRVVVASGDGLAAMAQVRVKKLPVARGGTAEIDWGPICVGESGVSRKALSFLITELRDRYAAREGLTLCVRPRGFTAGAESVVAALEEAGVVHNPSIRPYHTFVIDLSRSCEDIRTALHAHWRRDLARGQRQGISVTIEQSERAFAAFEALYWEMYHGKRFKTGVRIDRIRQMQHAMPKDDKLAVAIASWNGSPIGAGCFTLLGDTCVYFLGATANTAREHKLQPGCLLLWRVLEEAQSRGVRWYDLGGFDDTLGPQVTRFKAGMSGEKVVYPGQYDLHSRRGPSKAYFMAEKAYRSLRGLLQRMGVGR